MTDDQTPYWLCCGSRRYIPHHCRESQHDPLHARWGTAEQHAHWQNPPRPDVQPFFAWKPNYRGERVLGVVQQRPERLVVVTSDAVYVVNEDYSGGWNIQMLARL